MSKCISFGGLGDVCEYILACSNRNLFSVVAKTDYITFLPFFKTKQNALLHIGLFSNTNHLFL